MSCFELRGREAGRAGPRVRALGGGRVAGGPVSEQGTMHTFVGTLTLSPHGTWGACRKLLAFKGVQVCVPPAPRPTAQGRWSWDTPVGAPMHSWLPCRCWGTWLAGESGQGLPSGG